MLSIPMRNFFDSTLRRPLRAALFMGVAAIAVLPTPAAAAMDLLAQPAFQSGRAAKSMLLTIARAGERLVAAGERGVIVYSDDQGASWTQANVPVSVTLTTLCFVSRDTGWAAGHDGVILKTADGGKTWHKQFDGNRANTLVLAGLQARVKEAQSALEAAPEKSRATAATTLEALQNSVQDAKASTSFGPSMPLFGLWFRDATEGLVIGAFGQFIHTRDGGKTWESWGGRIANPEGLHFNSVAQLANGNLVITGEAGKLRRSRDEGVTWETLDTGYPGHLYGTLALPDSTVLLTYGFSGNVYKSSDDGRTWKPLPKLTNKPIVAGMTLPNGSILLVTGDGRVLTSRDQGGTFVLSTTPSGSPVAAVLPQLLPNNKLLLVGTGGSRLVNVNINAH